jgi:hypothetical protein
MFFWISQQDQQVASIINYTSFYSLGYLTVPCFPFRLWGKSSKAINALFFDNLARPTLEQVKGFRIHFSVMLLCHLLI